MDIIYIWEDILNMELNANNGKITDFEPPI